MIFPSDRLNDMEIEDFERHADESDIASDIEAKIIKYGIALARLKMDGPEPTGFCLNPRCEEAVEKPKKYCNADCASEHSKIQKLTTRRS